MRLRQDFLGTLRHARNAFFRARIAGAAALLGAVVLGLLLIRPFVAPLQTQAQIDKAHFRFEMSPASVMFPAGCVSLSWQVSGIREIYFNTSQGRQGVIGQDTKKFCAGDSLQPSFTVLLQDGTWVTLSFQGTVALRSWRFWLLLGLFIGLGTWGTYHASSSRLRLFWRRLARATHHHWERPLLLVGALWLSAHILPAAAETSPLFALPFGAAIVLLVVVGLTTRQRLNAALTTLLIAAVPFLVAFYVVYVKLGRSLADYIPSAPALSDSLYYWVQVDAFRAVSFKSGYFTYGEQPAPASFSHFGAWGPLFPMLYGSVAKLVGWEFWTSVVLNLALLSAALLCYTALAGPNAKQKALLLLTIASFWAMHLYSTTSMQESLHHAYGLVLAGLTFRLLTRPKPSRRLQAITLLSLFTFAVLRFSWALLIPFYSALTRPHATRKARAVSVLAGTAFSAVAIGLFIYLSAPYPSGAIDDLKNALAARSPLAFAEGVQSYLEAVSRALLQKPHSRLPVVQVLQVGAVLFASALHLFRHKSGGPQHATRTGWLLTLYILGVALITPAFFQYAPLQSNGYRIIATYFLFTLALLLALRQFTIVATVALLGALTFSYFLRSYEKTYAPQFTHPPTTKASIAAFGETVAQHITYRKGVSAWCNTVISDGNYAFLPHNLAWPDGIGLSTLLTPPAPSPLKSQYVFLCDPSATPWCTPWDIPSLQLLTKTEFGLLYLNLEAECPPPK